MSWSRYSSLLALSKLESESLEVLLQYLKCNVAVARLMSFGVMELVVWQWLTDLSNPNLQTAVRL